MFQEFVYKYMSDCKTKKWVIVSVRLCTCCRAQNYEQYSAIIYGFKVNRKYKFL